MYQRILPPNYKICGFSYLSRVKFNSSVLLLLSKLELWPFLILIVQRAIKSLPIPLPAVSLRDLSISVIPTITVFLLIPRTVFIDFCLQNPCGMW